MSAEDFHELLSTAEVWLRDPACCESAARSTFPINQECGLLVEWLRHASSDDYDGPLSATYYAARLTAEGYQGVKDLLAYTVTADPILLPPEFDESRFQQSRWLCAGQAAARAPRLPMRT